MWRAHLREHLVKPLERPMQMDLDPTGRRCHILAMVLRPPALHERHPDRAHLRELIDGLESIVHRLRQQLSKFLIVKDLQRAARRYLAHGARMESMVVVAIARLHKNGGVGQALGVHLAGHIVQMNALACGRKKTTISDCF